MTKKREKRKFNPYYQHLNLLVGNDIYKIINCAREEKKEVHQSIYITLISH